MYWARRRRQSPDRVQMPGAEACFARWQNAPNRFHAEPSKLTFSGELVIVGNNPGGTEVGGVRGQIKPFLLPGGFIKDYQAFQKGEGAFAVGTLKDFSRPSGGISMEKIPVAVKPRAFLGCF